MCRTQNGDVYLRIKPSPGDHSRSIIQYRLHNEGRWCHLVQITSCSISEEKLQELGLDAAAATQQLTNTLLAQVIQQKTVDKKKVGQLKTKLLQ